MDRLIDQEKFATSMLRKMTVFEFFMSKTAGNLEQEILESSRQALIGLWFLDADDYYNTKAVEYLVALKDQYGVDLVVTSIVEVRDHQTDLIAGDLPLEDSKN